MLTDKSLIDLTMASIKSLHLAVSSQKGVAPSLNSCSEQPVRIATYRNQNKRNVQVEAFLSLRAASSEAPAGRPQQ